MRSAVFLGLICLGPAIVIATPAGPSTDLDSIVEAERAFCKLSVEKGTRQAFLAYLAEDGVIFRPGPVDGRSWWGERPEPGGVLSWEPAFADVSRGGDLGYTTGPWEYREKSIADPPVAFGQYLTVWKRQPGGPWRVALDTGISHGKPTGSKPSGVNAPPREPGSSSGSGGPAAEASREREVLLALDRGVSTETFTSVADEAIRLYRSESFPAAGRQAARTALVAQGGPPSTEPTDAVISRTGDLAYTYGTAVQKKAGATSQPTERVGFLRIWKRRDRGSAWKLVIDVTTPFPPPTRPG